MKQTTNFQLNKEKNPSLLEKIMGNSFFPLSFPFIRIWKYTSNKRSSFKIKIGFKKNARLLEN